MASVDNRPSQSLINAAFTSLVGGSSMAAATAGVIAGATLVPGFVVTATVGGMGAILVDIAQAYYASMIRSVAADGQSIPRQILQGPIEVRIQCCAPEFDHDFTNIYDGSKTFVRGNQPYERPCGSYRIALKVKDKFGNDNTWLGMSGTDSGEWPVSYHGTAQHNARNIAQEGYKLSKGKRVVFGKGIYSTPELAVAKDYATEFQHEGTSYLCVFQNRVNPKYLKVIPKSENNHGVYWLSAADRDGVDESELIRPYGICLFKKN